jgi:hypothetical protein
VRAEATTPSSTTVRTESMKLWKSRDTTTAFKALCHIRGQSVLQSGGFDGAAVPSLPGRVVRHRHLLGIATKGFSGIAS